uniref:Uncharacterized protein n=1 Tax=Strongyloides stercoralis TaxID=6248 RepID=A0A0K0ESH1_STRER
MIIYILQYFILVILVMYRNTEAIKCFCKNADCDDSITCNGDYCIVGLGGQPGQSTLDQKCINHDDDKPEGCSQNWNGFTEIADNKRKWKIFNHPVEKKHFQIINQQEIINITKRNTQHKAIV